MIFPLKGTDKRGLVSLEAKKRKASRQLDDAGTHDFAQMLKWWLKQVLPIAYNHRHRQAPTSSDSLQGKYGFKLLAVDVPTAEGAEQRLFLDGDDKLYTRGGVMSELRDPFLRVSTNAKRHINRVLAHTLNIIHAAAKIGPRWGFTTATVVSTFCRLSPCSTHMKQRMRLMKQQMTLQKLRRSVYGRPPKSHRLQNPMMEDCTSLRELLIEHVSLHQNSRARQPQNLLKLLNQPIPGSPAANCIGWHIVHRFGLPHADKPSLFRTCLIIAQLLCPNRWVPQHCSW